MKCKFIAGNWKMNGSRAFNRAFYESLLEALNKQSIPQGLLVALAPPSVYLSQLSNLIAQTPAPEYLKLAAQDVSAKSVGAYTGDTAAAMLKEFSVSYAIVGHSERRSYQGETDAAIGEKALQAQLQSITPIVCLGETLPQRDQGKALTIVEQQLKAVLDCKELQADNIVLAYEPVWAIGTGRTATPQQAQEVHAHLRQVLTQLTSAEIAEKTLILYGGSMNSKNAKELLIQPDIDGGLIGGAALQVDQFVPIISEAAQILRLEQ